ncbi:TIGR04282 family arsenosugar biosynthesis glycosyltransferase [Thalassoglobus sp.]|uniref:TIGR04282 family arsenosugar biosynthesis glycosyltransferase n=1 Tax=Thalassoglobus sp. TaxID=2795869 RepID=UPI003AA7DC76
MPTLGIFVKQPIPGKVKTRLGAKIGNDRSAELYTVFQQDLLERCHIANVKRVLCYSSPASNSMEFFTELAEENDELWEQPKLELGERLKQFFAEALKADGPVVVIGSDSPTLPQSYIEQAFELLKLHDVVLGPAVDGGYYLIGQRTPVPEVFDGIDWSGVEVLNQTIQKVQGSGASLGLLPPWYDIDSLDDLIFLRGHLNAIECAGTTDEIPRRTRKLVEEILNALVTDN